MKAAFGAEITTAFCTEVSASDSLDLYRVYTYAHLGETVILQAHGEWLVEQFIEWTKSKPLASDNRDINLERFSHRKMSKSKYTPPIALSM